MSYRRPEYGSDLIVDLLQHLGIEYASLNPGSTFRGLHDSIVNYGGNRPEIIECCHEEVAVAMAHGYAKATGKPMAAIVHDVVGLLHATMAIYYAFLDRAPVLVLGATGPMATARRRPHIDWIHTAVVQGNVVRDYVKWDDQPFDAEGVIDALVRGYQIALTEPQGPVYLCFDAAFQEDPLEPEAAGRPLPSPCLPLPLSADQEALATVATLLVEAENPVVLVEALGRKHGTVAVLVQLAELLALPVIDLNGRFNFPNRHPLNLSGAALIEEADLVLALDVGDLYGPLTRLDRLTRRTQYRTTPGCRLVEMGVGKLQPRSWSQEMGKFQPVQLSILADTSVALPQLLRCCQQTLQAKGWGPERFQSRCHRLQARHEALQRQWQEEAQRDRDAAPMTPARLAAEVGEVLRGEDWVLTAGTLNDWARRLWTFDEPYRHPGRSLGTATQIGISLGVALAYKGTGRLVVDLQPDGDLLYDASALWTATHHQIPMLAVMYNNRAYYNDWEHQIHIARQRARPEEMAYLGMEIARPAPHFAQLAQSFGWYAEGPIEDPREVRGALTRALRAVKEGRPALIDTVTTFR